VAIPARRRAVKAAPRGGARLRPRQPAPTTSAGVTIHSTRAGMGCVSGDFPGSCGEQSARLVRFALSGSTRPAAVFQRPAPDRRAPLAPRARLGAVPMPFRMRERPPAPDRDSKSRHSSGLALSIQGSRCRRRTPDRVLQGGQAPVPPGPTGPLTREPATRHHRPAAVPRSRHDTTFTTSLRRVCPIRETAAMQASRGWNSCGPPERERRRVRFAELPV
jgi:hypothetical protein